MPTATCCIYLGPRKCLSNETQAAHLFCVVFAENACNSPGQLPHATVCPVLKHFSSCKADGEMQSVAFMCLDALALKASGKTIGASTSLLFSPV